MVRVSHPHSEVKNTLSKTKAPPPKKKQKKQKPPTTTKLRDTENKLVVEDMVGGMKWLKVVKRYKLLIIK